MQFNLQSDFKPTGDQPQAIKKLSDGILSDDKYQTLLGVTGSGKTFTIANVVQEVQRPTLVLAHNKTLARSEERRVGKECRAGWWRDQLKTKGPPWRRSSASMARWPCSDENAQ